MSEIHQNYMQFTLFYILFTSARFLSSTFEPLFNQKLIIYEETYHCRIFMFWSPDIGF